MSHTQFVQEQIEQLDSFLRGELSATETYSQVLDKFANEPPQITSVLELNRSSHRHRATILQREIRELGGEPATNSGVWGAFAKTIEAGASLLGRKPAIAMLEEGEDHGLADYHKNREELAPRLRKLLDEKLIPEQQRSHEAARRLKKIA